MALVNLDVLQAIQLILEGMDYETNLLRKSNDIPMDMLTVKLDQEDEGSDQQFVISVMPLSDDLEGSNFIQIYYEYPFMVDIPAADGLKNTLINVNRQLPLGHFNLTALGAQVYFKYVLASPMNLTFDAGHVSDFIDMCTFAMTHFEGEFKAFAKK